MKRSWEFYLKLFLSTFYLSTFTFGGGYVIVPLMRKKFVDEYKWIEEKEMLDLVAISQSAPGPIAVNASILVGYRLAGIPGAMITVFGTVLPCLVIISIISLFYNEFKQNAIVNTILRGMDAGVAAVIADVTFSMGKKIIGEKKIYGNLIMFTSFAAVFFFKVDVKIIILAGAIIGLSYTLYRRIRKKEMK